MKGLEFGFKAAGVVIRKSAEIVLEDVIIAYVGAKGPALVQKSSFCQEKRYSLCISLVPKTYGEFLFMLKKRGVEFYINTRFLIVSKIGIPNNP